MPDNHAGPFTASSLTRDEARLFEAIPGNNVLLQVSSNAFTIVACTETYGELVGQTRTALAGKDFFSAFLINGAELSHPPLRESFKTLLTQQQRQDFILPPYWMHNAGANHQPTWKMTNTPLLNGEGMVKYIVHSVLERSPITEQRVDSPVTEQERVNAFPIAMAMITGETFVLTSANERMLTLWHLTKGDIGRSLLHLLSSAEYQPFLDIIQEARSTRVTGYLHEQPVLIAGEDKVGYFDITCQFSPQDHTQTRYLLYAADVTRPVLARLEMEEKERRIRNIIQTAPFPIGVYVGEELRIEIANQAIINIWARGEDVIGKIYTELMAELSNQDIFEQLKAVYSTGISYHGKYQPITLNRDGHTKQFYFNYSFIPLFNPAGDVYAVLSTAADVTDLVTIKNEAELSESKGQLAIRSAELGTYELDLQTNFVVSSERFREIWGVDDSADRSVYEAMIHPEDVAVRAAALKAAYESTNLDYETRLVGKTGELKWVKVRGKILFNKEGISTRIIGVIQDITDQKLFAQALSKQVKERTEELETAHKLLLQSNEYLQKVLNLLHTPLQVLAPVMENDRVVDFRFRLTNSAYAAYAQRAPESIFDKRVGEVFPGYFQTNSFVMITKTWENGGTNTWENHYNADGLDIYNQMSATKMGDEVVVYFTDFTRLKHLQLELLRKIDELEISNRNLKEFAYAASHDLKEPIRKIHIFGGRLKKSLAGRLNAEEQNSFERMELASIRMGTLVDDLLAYSHVSLEAMVSQEVDLNQLVELVLSDLDLEIDQKKAEVQVGKLCKIQGHHRQLQQAFQNLIGNALKYSNEGIPPKITITTHELTGKDTSLDLSPEDVQKNFCVIEVEDNGIGFEQGDADIIFDVFTRLHGHLKYKGSGIGLSIVRKVIENHKGYIKVKSMIGTGTKFTLFLPL